MTTTTQKRRGTLERWWGRLRMRRGQITIHTVLMIAVLISVVPVLWSVSASFMGKADLYARDPRLLPSQPTLDNYKWVLGATTGGGTVGRYPIWFKNSVIVSGLTVVITLFVATTAGYAFGRLKFRGRDAIFYIVTLLMFIPRSGGLMALFEEMYFLGLRNSLVGLALLFAGGGGFMGAGMVVATFIMRQFFMTIPSEYDDAARVDGANRWQTFIHIMLPMATGAMAVVVILTFIAAWGEYLVTITMLDSPKMFTLAVGIAGTFMGGTVATVETTSYGAMSAAYNMFIIPVLIVFLATQKWFIKGLSGGLKL